MEIINLTTMIYEHGPRQIPPGGVVDSGMTPELALGLIYHNRRHFELTRKAFENCGLEISVEEESPLMQKLREILKEKTRKP